MKTGTGTREIAARIRTDREAFYSKRKVELETGYTLLNSGVS